MAKITFIGAGSVVFAKKLLGDVLQFPELAGVEIALMDIDPARLKVAEIMTRRMIEKLGVRASVQATLDRREAVRGAHYVICAVQIGGFKPATLLDFEIPARYGLRQTIADTLGVGGVFRGLRTIPVLVGLARDIAEQAAPGCILLNYSNPMAMNCWGVARATGIPHVGLCHSVQGTSRLLAGFAGLPYEDVRYLVAGINHMAFFLRFEYRGQDAYPLLFKALEDPSRTTELVRFEMMRRLGYFVTESSEHQSEYVPYFIHHGPEVIDRFRIPINEYIRRCEAIVARWQETERQLLGEGGDIAIEPQSFEYGARIIHARETNRPAVIYGNVPNTGLITNLPQGCCVEVPVLVDGVGLQPTVIGDLPPQLAAICRTNINVQELTVEAALSGKREHIYHAVMLDPHASATLTLDQIWRMCDELIEAHQNVGTLGTFAPVVANTGRAAAGIADRVIAQVRLATALGVAPGEETTLEVEAENPGSESRDIRFRLELADEVLAPVGEPSVQLAVPAGGTARATLRVRTLRPLATAVRVGLGADSDTVLCRGLNLQPRMPLRADASGSASFEIELAGVTAMRVALADRGGQLVVRIHAEDSAIATRAQGRSVIDSSGLRLFVTPRAGGEIRQVYVQPDPAAGRAAILLEDATPVAGAHGTLQVTELDYTIEATLPKAALGLAPDAREFLLNAHACLGALGDAHSGGIAVLVDQFAPWSRDESFAHVQL
jgi:alpha-galactosidase